MDDGLVRLLMGPKILCPLVPVRDPNVKYSWWRPAWWKQVNIYAWDGELGVWAGTGRLAKNASLTGDVLLNGRRKANLSYGTAVSFIHHPTTSHNKLPLWSCSTSNYAHLIVLITRADRRDTLISFKCEGTFFKALVIMITICFGTRSY